MKMRVRGVTAWVFVSIPLGLLGFILVWEPLRFWGVKHRIDTAVTSEQERTALEIARQWGRVWEVHAIRLDTGTMITNKSIAGVFSSNPETPIEVEIEWLEVNPWSGLPYRASHQLVDNDNIYLFFQRPQN